MKEKDILLDAADQASSLEQFSKLLEKCLEIFEHDRKLAIENYEMFKDQLEDIRSEFQMSDGGKIEDAVNDALRQVFSTGERLEKVVSVITRINLAQMNNASKERMVDKVVGGAQGGGNQIPLGAVDLKGLIETTRK